MLSTTPVLRLSPVMFLCLALALPAHASPNQVDPRVAPEAAGAWAADNEVAVEVEPVAEPEPEPVAKPKTRPKRNAAKAQHTIVHDKPRVRPVLPSEPRSEPKVYSSSLTDFGRRLGWGVLLALAVGGLGAAGFYRRQLRRSALTIEDLQGRRRGGEANVQRLTAEVRNQEHRAVQAEDGQRRAIAANQDLLERLKAAEAEVRRLLFELSLAPVRSQMEEIALNRAVADPDADLDMEDEELPDDLSEQARLTEEAKRLKAHLAILRKAGKRSPNAVALQDVLNGEEQTVFWAALAWTKRNSLRLHPQVSMGEFLNAGGGGLKDKVFRAFNARRVDFLISDRNWKPLLVIEHQGTGHRKGNWRLHDAVKRVVLRLAGLPLTETFKGEDDDVIHAKL